CAARDLATWAAPQAFANGTPWVLFLLTLLALGLSLPWLLRHLWDTRPLGKGGLRDRLEAAGHRLQVSSPQILIWRTKGRVVNAAVTGILPRWRYVLLSDGLLQRLTDDQVVAMYRHELGHVRYGHPQLRLLALAAPLAAWQTVIWLLPEPVANLTGRLAELSGGQWLSAVGLPLAAFSLYGLTFFSWYSRMMELQADLCACGVTLSPREQRERQSGTSEEEFRQFASTLYRLTQIHGQRSGGGGLLHPTMHDRIRFVRQAIRNPQTLAHFHKRMRRIAICLAATVMAGILVPLVTCWT
ncbi:MAG: M48 family metalloprotease, partial [Planctomycetales bacterium]|nr:M48 family metalloprotease [Planctomycetales bacterium]NIM07566.1 M48 family metalloprotease [Planctomycetales bacterium]NIN07072.1 M48 family metalloprotease [Planctomycetales bacterium]NIN76166.1 M48 family metalloprotease [Planctomycetales bacterium]NIO33388.1 M48 family metalloprotease [Planctomycetales bacterium]